jgi:hypothetical protein
VCALHEQNSLDIEIIAHRLQLRLRAGHHTVLLLGSRAGALYRSNLHRKLEEVSLSNLNALPSSERFEACYHILLGSRFQFSETELHQLLGTTLQEVEFSSSDFGLADLIQQGYFNKIITTNIDDTLERVLNMINVKDVDIIIGNRTKMPRFAIYRNRYQLIKLFGDFVSREYTLKERAKYIHEKNDLKEYLQELLAGDVLMIGIDPLWDEALIHLIPFQGETLWFVDEEYPDEQTVLGKLLRERQAQYVSGIEGNYERFIFMLYQHLCRSSPFNYKLGRDLLNHMDDIKKRMESLEEHIEKMQGSIQNIITIQNKIFEIIAKNNKVSIDFSQKEQDDSLSSH